MPSPIGAKKGCETAAGTLPDARLLAWVARRHAMGVQALVLVKGHIT